MTANRPVIEAARSASRTVMVVLSLVAIATVGLSGMAAAETDITDCRDITSSGTYVLGADLTKDQTGNGDACIEITADHVYLDGQGHTITGGDPIEIGNYGIYVNGSTNVTITDVTVDGWDRVGHGLRTDGATDITVRDVTASNNSIGVSVLRTDGFVVEKVRAEENNRFGMQAYNSSMGVLRDVSAVNNSRNTDGWSAIRVAEESSDVLVENATVTGNKNDGDGIRVSYDILSNVTIRDATVLDNDGAGLRIESGAVTIEDVTSYGNNWSVALDTTGFVEIPSLNLGESTAPDTTLSLEAMSVRVRGVQEPEQNSNAADIGRYFEVEGIDTGIDGVTGQYDVAVHYEDDDLGRIDASTLSLWWFHPELNPGWGEISGSTADTDAQTVNVSTDQFGVVGVFGTAPVASFDVSPANETLVQGEPMKLEFTNVTDTKGQPFTGSQWFDYQVPSGVRSGPRPIENGEYSGSLVSTLGSATEDLEPGVYTDLEVALREDASINDTYDVLVKANTFTVESEFAGVVYDHSGLAINATWLPVQDGEATLTVAGQEIPDPVTIENRNVSTTVDLSEHLDPETATGMVTVELGIDMGSWQFGPLTDEVRLVHEAYALDEGYTRWSIPQPAELYVTDGVVDMTQWSNAETSYDDVGFQVNAGETVTNGEDLHKGLYVNAGTADERIGYDFVTPGEEGLAPGGAETIDEGWNLLSSNFDISIGGRELNLDLNTVSSLPPTAADYDGNESMVVHHPSAFVRIGGDDVIGPYDTYWVYVDVGVESETRAISTAEYYADVRANFLEADGAS